jgi:3-deoxy-manno-octulosonate cytidylyltransferase (CMP-KDO synthetase)
VKPRFKVVIPARYASTRLPGKPLLAIAGKPLLQHVYEAAAASRAEQVIIATDDDRIKAAAAAFGATAVMTSAAHQSGTDRIAEAVAILNLPDDAIIVNVQGDEFGLPPAIIDQLAAALHENPSKPMATLCEQIVNRADLANPHVVKLIVDRDQSAMYFSRSAIPWFESAETPGARALPCPPLRHIGIYAYRAGFLKTFADLPPCPIEISEKLEQLRALFHGHRIHVAEACAPCGKEINTSEDLERVRRLGTSG